MTPLTPYSVTSLGDLIPRLPGIRDARAVAVSLETDGDDPRASVVLTMGLCMGQPTESTGQTNLNGQANLNGRKASVLRIDCRAFSPGELAPLHEALCACGATVFRDAAVDLQFLAALGIRPLVVFDAKLALGLLSHANRRAAAPDFPDAALLRETPATDMGGEPDALLRLRSALIPEIVRHGLVAVADIEFQCARAVARMEYDGIHLDLEKWDALCGTVTSEREAARQKLLAYTARPAVQGVLWGEEAADGPNFDSGPFMLSLLRNNGIPAKDTSRYALYQFRDEPLVRDLTAYRKASKALSSFLLPFPSMVHPATGRLHPRYGQLTVASGRMSCSHPNIQQIPRDAAFRGCFTAPPGRCLVMADYSQIELRVAAQISGDRRMLAAYQAGEDLHLLTASHIANKPMALVTRQERQAYKAVNLGLVYGMGARGLRRSAEMSYGVAMSMEEAETFRERFFATYAGIAAWHRRAANDASNEARTLTGRKFSFRPEAGLPERSNLPVQGTAADIMKKALGLLAARLDADTRMVAAVHDEILLECPEDAAPRVAEALRSAMEDAAAAILPDVPTPVEAVISASWAEK